MIDGKSYLEFMCEDCKKNIALQMSKLSAKDKLRPKRLAKKSVGWICDDCRRRIAEELKK